MILLTFKEGNAQHEHFAIDMHNVADVNNWRQNTGSPSPLSALFPTVSFMYSQSPVGKPPSREEEIKQTQTVLVSGEH